jgi:hypothetical protein
LASASKVLCWDQTKTHLKSRCRPILILHGHAPLIQAGTLLSFNLCSTGLCMTLRCLLNSLQVQYLQKILQHILWADPRAIVFLNRAPRREQIKAALVCLRFGKQTAVVHQRFFSVFFHLAYPFVHVRLQQVELINLSWRGTCTTQR